MEMNNLYQAIVETALNAGLQVFSDEKCCRLMAWLLNIGGYTEESTHNSKLKADIFYAQKRLNILGGEIPTPENIPMIKKYHKELIAYLNEEIEKPQWLIDLENYYQLRPYKNHKEQQN